MPSEAFSSVTTPVNGLVMFSASSRSRSSSRQFAAQLREPHAIALRLGLGPRGDREQPRPLLLQLRLQRGRANADGDRLFLHLEHRQVGDQSFGEQTLLRRELSFHQLLLRGQLLDLAFGVRLLALQRLDFQRGRLSEHREPAIAFAQRLGHRLPRDAQPFEQQRLRHAGDDAIAFDPGADVGFERDDHAAALRDDVLDAAAADDHRLTVNRGGDGADVAPDGGGGQQQKIAVRPSQ